VWAGGYVVGGTSRPAVDKIKGGRGREVDMWVPHAGYWDRVGVIKDDKCG
jgi:hypothetical protein